MKTISLAEINTEDIKGKYKNHHTRISKYKSLEAL